MDALITLLPGDGIGPEVTKSGQSILETIGEEFGHNFTFSNQQIGGSGIDHCNNPLPSDTVSSCKESNAVILGAVGGPKWDDPNAKIRPEQGLLGLRALLKVFANIRPIQIIPSLSKASPLKEHLLKNIDLLVIRELTGGIYFGEKQRNAARSPSKPCSGLIFAFGLSHLGPPTAPNITALDSLQLETVSEGKGSLQ